ncbi:MAG: FAD-dependent oxidoreductase [Candidatus Hydrogenedentes bacterium]|nr:FAD-dependent oxidoreductase [Candidatus Hydrogenedentota bacterium]
MTLDSGIFERPLRVAIVGSGPSGFYAADPLLKSERPAAVDMFDRLPTPFGLVRGGVAPDHEKIRNVTRVYERIADRPGFRFFGNVTIGRDLDLADLRQHYDAIILAYGAETDRAMGVPGEDLPGSYTATSFVGWYNGHPDYRDAVFDLQQEAAAIVGVGNVAMDVARILAKTVDELRTTDIATHALEALAESKVREIHLIGRRGPAQAAFTALELKEMGRLVACQPIVDPAALALGPRCEEELSDNNRARNLELLREFAAAPDRNAPRRLYFRFLESPVALEGNGRVESLRLGRNRLEGNEPFKQWAEPTGETFDLPCGLVFRSIGYRGIGIPGIPFDQKRGVVPNVAGRVTDSNGIVPGLYAAGWIKRGPSGIIGTNKPDSLETVERIWEDREALPPCPRPDPEAIPALLASRGVRYVTMADWRQIDAAEQAAGAASGKPRERFTRVADMLAVLDGPGATSDTASDK